MVDQNTRFIIKRMDEMEHRVNSKIEKVDEKVEHLTALENRLLGMAFVVGGIGSLVFGAIVKHF